MNNKIYRICIILLMHILFILPFNSFSQGKAHNWLIGYDVGLFDTNVTSTKARLLFDANTISVIPESRKMPFRATQGNISDENGNLIIVSNGCWIANSLGDTMLNGTGLNPGFLTSGWCDNTSGLPIAQGNIVLPFPGDSTKYILFHQLETKLFYSLIDMTLDGGLGGVVQKNILLIQDSITWGLAATKHANGRDWWIVALKDNSNIIYELLLTPDTITSITTQVLNMPATYYINACQPNFSPDGSKFAYTFGYGGPNSWHDVRILNFDRCSGYFDSLIYIPPAPGVGLGSIFSPNSNIFYHSSFNTIFQLDLISFNQDTVAINDGYYSPYPPFQTDFWYMYLAANGKIYVSSGNGVIDMHYINYPDSSGLSCDIHQHGLHLPCFYVRGNVYHPNYYLGPVAGSICDTLGLSLYDNTHDFKLTISPNPNDGNFKISYLLPQNKTGKIEIFDFQGKYVFKMNLPPWSSLQYISLPNNISPGIYDCRIISGLDNINRKIVVIN